MATQQKQYSYTSHVGDINTDEFLVISHMRQWCHNSLECPWCAQERKWVDRHLETKESLENQTKALRKTQRELRGARQFIDSLIEG